jgi:chitodextrinase
VIDEIRIYNRALTQGQIQTDMTTSVAPSDMTRPSPTTGLTATAVSTSQINLGWDAASDNVGVTGYQLERCQGAGCTSFAQIATPPGTSFSDTGRLAGTTYRYRVRATDAAGNLGDYSDIASATTQSPPPALGLVASYAADENQGNTLNDFSGNGNHGTITGASWSTSGRFGAALSFNGSGNRVRVNSSASLNLTTAMTLEAWIRPTASQSGWRTIMQKEVDAWFLNASNSSGPLRPAGGGTFGGTVAFLSGTVANPVNAWTHVALTYDGAALRLYVNAIQVNSTARTGSIQTTGNPLWIGGNSPYGEYFRGLIDEMRVYNRALNQGEIQNDMETRVAP